MLEYLKTRGYSSTLKTEIIGFIIIIIAIITITITIFTTNTVIAIFYNEKVFKFLLE